jgi:hypothetical protein
MRAISTDAKRSERPFNGLFFFGSTSGCPHSSESAESFGFSLESESAQTTNGDQ